MKAKSKGDWYRRTEHPILEEQFTYVEPINNGKTGKKEKEIEETL